MSKNGHAHAHISAKFYLKNQRASHQRTQGAHVGTKMFAIYSVDNTVKELFLTCIVFKQFEKKYLAVLNILAKCDFLDKITMYNHLWKILKQPSTLIGAPLMISNTNKSSYYHRRRHLQQLNITCSVLPTLSQGWRPEYAAVKAVSLAPWPFRKRKGNRLPDIACQVDRIVLY